MPDTEGTITSSWYEQDVPRDPWSGWLAWTTAACLPGACVAAAVWGPASFAVFFGAVGCSLVFAHKLRRADGAGVRPLGASRAIEITVSVSSLIASAVLLAWASAFLSLVVLATAACAAPPARRARAWLVAAIDP